MERSGRNKFCRVRPEGDIDGRSREQAKSLAGMKGRAYSSLMPANLMSLAHFTVSSAICLPKSAGEPGSTVPPRPASRPLSLGSARAALISLLSRSTISGRVFLGAPTPSTRLDS